MAVSKVFYAGGAKGPNVRADGKGGSLARGWYISTNGAHVIGPASFRQCREHPHFGGAEIEPKHKHIFEEHGGLSYCRCGASPYVKR